MTEEDFERAARIQKEVKRLRLILIEASEHNLEYDLSEIHLICSQKRDFERVLIPTSLIKVVMPDLREEIKKKILDLEKEFKAL